jgi:hypothetical protein
MPPSLHVKRDKVWASLFCVGHVASFASNEFVRLYCVEFHAKGGLILCHLPFGWSSRHKEVCHYCQCLDMPKAKCVHNSFYFPWEARVLRGKQHSKMCYKIAFPKIYWDLSHERNCEAFSKHDIQLIFLFRISKFGPLITNLKETNEISSFS